MGVDLVVLISFALLLGLLAFSVPVAFSLAIAGTVGILLLNGSGTAIGTLGGLALTSVNSYSFAVIPLYILLGMFAVQSGIPRQLYEIGARLTVKIPGGLGLATLIGSAGFATVSGSTLATAVTMTRISLHELLARNYSPRFATAIIAASGTLGMLIPPSIILVMYAIITGESTAEMLAAGVVPGILSAIVYGVYIVYRGRKDESAVSRSVDAHVSVHNGGGTVPPASSATTEPVVADTKIRDLPFSAIPKVLFLVVAVFLGIYTGFVTVTESAALGALLAFAFMLHANRRKGLKAIWHASREALVEAASTTSMALTLVLGASVFSLFLTMSGLPSRFAAMLIDANLSASVVVIIVLIALIPLGAFLESLSVMLIVLPIMYPALMALGVDGVWFGILVVKLIELGLITPPVGIGAFVVAGSSGVPAETVFRGLVPFWVLDLIVVALLFLFPDLVLWLPSMVAG